MFLAWDAGMVAAFRPTVMTFAKLVARLRLTLGIWALLVPVGARAQPIPSMPAPQLQPQPQPPRAYGVEDPESGDHAEATRLGLIVGGFTPVGWLGAEVTPRLGQHLEVGLGGGFAPSGPQASIMPRLVVARSGVVSVLAGAGMSVGKLDTVICWWGSCDGVSATALWGNAELGVEVTASTGMFVRAFAGYEKELLRRSVDYFGTDTSDDEKPFDVPYVGFMIGHTLCDRC